MKNVEAYIFDLEQALEDAINSPKGVVPKSAEPFWDGHAGRLKRSIVRFHYSDCAVHNAPSGQPGLCDCGGVK